MEEFHPWMHMGTISPSPTSKELKNTVSTDSRGKGNSEQRKLLPLRRLNNIQLFIFIIRRAIFPIVDVLLSLYTAVTQYDSCTSYFIAATFSLTLPRYVFFPLALLALLVCIGSYGIMYYHMSIRYRQVRREGVTKIREILPFLSKMMAMTDKTPLGIRQKKFNLIELIFQDIFQLGIGYYNLNASRVNFTWLAYAKIAASGVKLAYQFANYISTYFMSRRFLVKSSLFILFTAFALALSIGIPRALVLYDDGIDVRRLTLTTFNQTCYTFTTSSNFLQNNIAATFPQHSCSKGESSLVCPPFNMVNLENAPASSIVDNAQKSFFGQFYYAPVYQAYMTKSGSTEKLLFEYETTTITNLCGNAGSLFPDNMFFTSATLNNLYHVNNTWISLSAGLKILSKNAEYNNVSFYLSYLDGNSGNPYFVVGSASLKIEYTCQLRQNDIIFDMSTKTDLKEVESKPLPPLTLFKKIYIASL
ncbi:hypothetical protein HDV06_000565 [Boothiomyces sp. JEL0866]|nr:hypothetical protein HDV06_000565 [Boothiomyces sp. JEL0866]